jgi:hypothetical protein
MSQIVSTLIFLFFLGVTFKSLALRYNHALYEPEGDLAVYSLGGTATFGDSSFIDSNPATFGLLSPQYTLSGGSSFNNSGLEFLSLGVLDTKTSEMAAGVKVRQTGPNTGGYDRKYSLVLAYDLFNTKELRKWGGFSIGVTYHYFNISDEAKTRLLNTSSFNLGMVKNLNFLPLPWPVNVGVSLVGLNDPSDQKYIAFGMTHVFLKGSLIVNMDGFVEKSAYNKTVLSASITPHEFLNFKASLGYENPSKKLVYGLGAYLQSQWIRMYYLFHTAYDNPMWLVHDFGLDFVLAI